MLRRFTTRAVVAHSRYSVTTTTGTIVSSQHAAASQVRTFFHATPVALFDIKEHQKQRRKQREMEKLGVEEEDDLEGQWLSDEDKQKQQEEEERRKAEMELRAKEMLAQREQDDEQKKKAFKSWRADQLRKSRDQQKKRSEKKAASGVEKRRAISEDVDENIEQRMRDKGDFDDSKDEDATLMPDADERRSIRHTD